ncbi:MAG: ABC transporter ATP-binding protein [Dehalococcoidia bacterium]|nr:ABC transporter ATP-binding protein [Dehalococcoidia bacterium]
MSTSDQLLTQPVKESASSASDDVNLFTGLRLLIPFARFGWHSFAAAGILASLSSLALLGPFWAIYRAVDDVIAGIAQRDSMYMYAALAAGFLVLQYALMAAAEWTSHRGAYATLEHLRLRIGERLGRVPLGFLTNRRTGEVQRTLIDDIERLELFLAHVIPDVVSALSTMLFMIAWLAIVDWQMALVSLVVVFVSIPILGVGMTRGSAKLTEYTRSMSRMNASVVEFVRAMPVVRTFNGTRRVFGETKAAIDDAAQYQAEWGREFLPTFTAFFVILTSPILTIVPLGLWLWHTGRIDTSTLLFYFIVGLGFTVPLLRVLSIMTQFAVLGLGARLVRELDDADVLPEVAVESRLNGATLEVRDVDFSYEDRGEASRQVLQGISFTAEPGTVTAVVGPSGAGKSTLARLIVRFWDVDKGAIRIGGVDIREMPIRQLMDQVAFVFQETFLFNDSVAANLLVAKPDATHEEIVEAAKAANAHEFVEGLPQGYDTLVGEAGDRLSGGERQRLAIARAILKDAPIVILDEATAYADPENEIALQGALDRLVQGRTVIIIAHRLTTVAGADQTLVLDEGQVVERGQHDDLIQRGGLYTEMWEAFTTASSMALTGGSEREHPAGRGAST